MNKFQAMARIMSILSEDARLQKGSQRYKIARKRVEAMIEKMGPDAAYSCAKGNTHELLAEIEACYKAAKAGRILSHFI